MRMTTGTCQRKRTIGGGISAEKQVREVCKALMDMGVELAESRTGVARAVLVRGEDVR